jgi:hypothetical protein
MPIQVYIEVNGKPVESIHICRTSKTVTNDEAEYLVLAKPAINGTPHRSRHYDPDLPSYREWEDKGVPFTHEPGDGLTVCVEKGLAALNTARAEN